MIKFFNSKILLCQIFVIMFLFISCGQESLPPESVLHVVNGRSPLIFTDFYSIQISSKNKQHFGLLTCDTFWDKDYDIRFTYRKIPIKVKGIYFSDSLSYHVEIYHRDTIRRLTGKDWVGTGVYFKRLTGCTFGFSVDSPLDQLSKDFKSRFIDDFDTSYFPGIIK